MSAAVEGCIESIPSVGFSLCSFSVDANFDAAQKIASSVADKILQNGLPKGVCLNVNVPNIEFDKINGIKICRQANAMWEEELDERKDPAGQTYYWLTGVFKNYDTGEDTDEWALSNQYVSVVPVHTDFTAHHTIPFLKKWDL
jgi:5'-nucleotidase